MVSRGFGRGFLVRFPSEGFVVAGQTRQRFRTQKQFPQSILRRVVASMSIKRRTPYSPRNRPPSHRPMVVEEVAIALIAAEKAKWKGKLVIAPFSTVDYRNFR